jgi:hypothetical protein
MGRVRNIATAVRDARLPKDERAASRAERAAETAMRSERERVDEHAMRRAAAEAELRRHHPTGIGGWAGGSWY